MAAPRDRKHIIVPGKPIAEPFRAHQQGGGKKPPRPANRVAHGQALQEAFAAAIRGAQQRRADAGIQVHGAVPGLYVQFESQPGVSLALSQLESTQQGIELVAVTYAQTDEAKPRNIERATVLVPEGKERHFVTRFESYSKTTPKQKRERRYEDMLDPVATLRLATLRGLWTDATEVYPADQETIWWEVWLRRQDGRELARLMEFAALQHIEIGPRRLQFDDRIVTLARATPTQLAASLDVLDDVAEVRRAKETAAAFDDMGPEEQGEWAKELRARTTGPRHDAPAVCVLDTGVTRGHPLLETALASTDCHACDPAWGTHDHHGHGTEMAGLALYGDLTPVLASLEPVRLRHGLESVKILPRHGANAPELYGAIIAEATSRVEIQAPERRRCYSLAIASTDERDRGQPTSWSAAVDALAAGRAFDVSSQGLVYLDGSEPVRRLFVVSAGNVDRGALQVAHLDRSDSIRPFTKRQMREMHIFDLPWPTDVLRSLGGTSVRLRVTLSYFIEPNPGRRGWKRRHSYASHGLRYDVKGPTESVEEFRKRLNQHALDEEEEKPRTDRSSSPWYLGKQAREHGSIHSDFLYGSAAELAERGVIGIYPVSGWWKEQPKRDRSELGARYALIVSIETPDVETDIWTPVAQQVGVPIGVET